MKRNVVKARVILALLLAAALAIGAFPQVALAQGTINCWVERPDNHGGDPGDPTKDPADINNFVLFGTEEGSQPEPFLRTEALERRFAHLIASETMADGSINAYYARGVFRYEFDVFHELGEMTILDQTFRAGDEERYFVNAKYQQDILFPGLENGLIPTLMETDLLNAYCAGWAFDPRTGDNRLLTHVYAVSESMLPTDDMPYEDLTFLLTAVWFEGDDTYVLSSWFEESPSEVNVEGLNRIDYNGKTYVNYPDTDVEVNMPRGSKPSASSTPGLLLITQIEPNENPDDPEGSTWKFLYDRETFDLSFDTGGAESLKTQYGIPFQQNLAEFDPGWDSSTTRTQGGATYQFAGWFHGEYFVSYNLADMYMPPFDLHLEAKWEKK